MFSTELSSELRNILDAVTPRFEESLKRAFQNEGVRRQHLRGKKDGSHALDDVLVTAGDNVIELRDLKLLRSPDFRVNQLVAELGKLTLNLSLNLGNLRIEGEYYANNKVLQKWLPITSSGKITATVESVLASGRVGLSIVEDSFVVQHYDIDYKPGDVTIQVTYQEVESSTPVIDEISGAKLEDTLAATFWPQLTDVITNLLHRQLGAVIVEDSVTELLADNDEELREYARQQAVKANRLMDSLLCTAKGQIVSKGSRSLKISELSVAFNRKQPGKQRGSFEAKDSYIQDLSTITRKNDMSLYENEDEVAVYGSVSLREFKYGYEKYKAEYIKTAIEGSIRTTIYRNQVFLKVLFSKKDFLLRLERVRVCSLNDIDVDISGFGSLSWLTERIQSWVIGKLRNEGLDVLEKEIRLALESAIQSVDGALLLAD